MIKIIEMSTRLTSKSTIYSEVILNEFGAFIFISRRSKLTFGMYCRIRFQSGVQRFKTFSSLGSNLTLTLGYKK